METNELNEIVETTGEIAEDISEMAKPNIWKTVGKVGGIALASGALIMLTDKVVVPAAKKTWAKMKERHAEKVEAKKAKLSEIKAKGEVK